MFISDKRLCLTRDGRVVEDGHLDAATLLVAKGGALSTEDAKRYGLLTEEKPQVEEKAVEVAPENKAIFPSANKRKK